MLLLSLTAQAQDASGFAEVRGIWMPGADGTNVQLVERVRPTFEAEITDRILFATTIEAGLAQGRDLQTELQDAIEASDLGILFDPAIEALGGEVCTWPDDNANETFDIDDIGDWMAVDRLYADIYNPKVDIRIGRQALQWGSAQFVNPTDPFPQVLVTQPWLPRAGVNAVRATVPVGEHEISGVVAANDTFTSLRAAGRQTLNVGTTDLSLVGAYRGDDEDGLVGIDVRGTLGVGFWVEAAMHVEDRPYEELAIGIDYSLPVFDRFLLGAQYYRYGAGGTGPDDYDLTSRLSSQDLHFPDCGDQGGLAAPEDDGTGLFDPFFAARDYGMVFALVSFNPEISSNVAVIQNARDGTGMAIPTVMVAATGWLTISAGAQIPYKLDGGGEFAPRPRDLRLTVGEGQFPQPLTADLSGLLPDATVFVYTRANF